MCVGVSTLARKWLAQNDQNARRQLFPKPREFGCGITSHHARRCCRNRGALLRKQKAFGKCDALQTTNNRPQNTRQAKSTQGRPRRSVGGCRPRNKPKHAKHNSSFLKSDLESTRELGRLQGGPFHSHSERPTVGRPRGDPRCGSTQGRLPAVDLGRTLPNLR